MRPLPAYLRYCPECSAVVRESTKVCPMCLHDIRTVKQQATIKGYPVHPQLAKLYQRDKGICHLCLREVKHGVHATRDHIIPRSEGGRNSMDNLKLAHKGCNGLRGSMSIEEARERLRKYYVVNV